MNISPHKPALSMLDLVTVREGATVAQALALAVRTAQHVESLGFTRYWMAEHHNMPGIASSATAVLIGHVAGATQSIRVGSGGIMLPNHAPLVVAEAFGTLAELYPGRIDLGLGRAPGTDGPTMRALRRDRVESEQDFPRDVAELQRLLAPAEPGQRITAVPGAGTNVPIWLLGSSLFSAQLAAEKGLPYAFASHFAPRMLHQAIDIYRRLFRPSATLQRPYVAIGVPVIAAPTDEEADYLASSTYQRVLGILTGQRGLLRLPPDTLRRYVAQVAASQMQLAAHAIGDSTNHLLLNLYGAALGPHSGRRWRIEHAQIVTPADVALFGRYGVIPSVQPAHATSDMAWAGQRLGPARLPSAYAYAALLGSARHLALGSDFPVEDINPLFGFYAAVTRQDAQGHPAGGFLAANRLSRRAALCGMTTGAAYANFDEQETGQIKPGMRADFVLLDVDLLTAPMLKIRAATVQQTWVNGVRVH